MVWKEFKNWLLGKEKAPDAKEIRVNLKVQRKRLDRIEQGMRKERKEALKKVRRALRNEEREVALEHAKIAVTYSKDLSALAKSKAKIVQVLNFLQRATITKSFSESIKNLSNSLGEIRQEIASPKLKEALSQSLMESERIELRTETLYDTLDMGNVGSDVEKAAKHLVEDIAVEEGIREKPVKEEEIRDEEVEKLLKEVKEELK